ncbi:MAG: hypothetical protein AAFW67_01210, partial [Cyanobacteria bacterium J06638_38]
PLLVEASPTILVAEIEQERMQTSRLISPKLIERWFCNPQKDSNRLNYRQCLQKMLTDDEINVVKKVFTQHLSHKTVDFGSTIVYLKVSSK